MPSKSEPASISELAGQLRTQVEYLRELGIDGAVEFAGLDAKFARSTARAAAATPQRQPRQDEEEVGALYMTRDMPVSQPAPQRPAARLADLPRLGAPRTARPSTGSSLPTAKPVASAGSKPSAKSMDALFAGASPTRELPPSAETLAEIQASIGACTLCPLHEGRTHIVHTEGNANARLMFIGEAPGADEDAQARPFVGRAGQLLNKIIEAIGLRRDEVLIGNINRCRPPGNRPPVPDEVAACKPFLLREIGAARPEVIVVMGNTAMKNLLGAKEGITKVRGIFQDYYGIKVMPTFHPAYLLRDPSKKRETWDDLKKVRDYLAQHRPGQI